jgi:4-amino-4-deoxy-L-arabinose transferase-like glycosyltransferase
MVSEMHHPRPGKNSVGLRDTTGTSRIMNIVKQYKWPLIIFFSALVLRAAYLFQIQHTPLTDFLLVDSKFYHEWAKNIAAGDWLGGNHTFVMAPLYAYFLAIIYWLGGSNFQAALSIQIFIGSASCVLAYFVAEKYLNRLTAIIAGISCAVYPVFIFYDGTLLKENLMVFVSLLFVLMYPVAVPEPSALSSRRRLVFCGVLVGLNALMRPTIFLLPPLIFAWEWLASRKDALKRLGWMVLGIAIVIAPVALRNKYVGGEWVVTVASGGMNFWTGNNPTSHGAYVGAPFVTSEEPQYEDEDFRKEASRRLGRELTVSQASDYWYKEGFSFLVNNPARSLWLMWRKTLSFWHKIELPSDLNYYFARDFSSVIGMNPLSFGLFAPLGLMGIILAWRRFPKSRLLTFFIASNFLASIIFFNSSRYRLPVVALIIIFAAYFLAYLYDIFVVRKLNLSVEFDLKIFAPFILFFVLCNYHDTMLYAISRTRLSYRNASAMYLSAGNVGRAKDMAEHAVTIDPEYALGWSQYAYALYAAGQKEQASEAYRRAQILSAENRDARFERSNKMLK